MKTNLKEFVARVGQLHKSAYSPMSHDWKAITKGVMWLAGDGTHMVAENCPHQHAADFIATAPEMAIALAQYEELVSTLLRAVTEIESKLIDGGWDNGWQLQRGFYRGCISNALKTAQAFGYGHE